MSTPTAACPGADPCALAHGYAGLECWKGWPLAVAYSAGTDLTGAGLAFTVRHPVTGAELLELTSAAGGGITLTDPAAGAAGWTLTAAQTGAANLPPGQYPFTVALTDAAGAFPAGPEPLTWGRLLVRVPGGAGPPAPAAVRGKVVQ